MPALLLREEGGEDADEQWQSFEEARSQIGTVRRWVWVAWLIPVLLLAGIGALGGRRWNSKLVWAASVLAMASAIAYAAFGPLFSALAKPRINDALCPAFILISARVVNITRRFVNFP